MKRFDRAPRRMVYVSTATVFVVFLATCAISAEAATADQATGPEMQDFERRLVDYLNLRQTLSEKMMPLAPTPSARELETRLRELAAALRAARAAAKPGDLVPASIAARIHAVILEDFKRRSAADERATFSEVPNTVRPAINRTYPAAAALPTVPPLLLSRLPRLPENLQYRFYGRHLVVLDGDAQIIVDYIANVLPSH
jgi:hypothetical protein